MLRCSAQSPRGNMCGSAVEGSRVAPVCQIASIVSMALNTSEIGLNHCILSCSAKILATFLLIPIYYRKMSIEMNNYIDTKSHGLCEIIRQTATTIFFQALFCTLIYTQLRSCYDITVKNRWYLAQRFACHALSASSLYQTPGSSHSFELNDLLALFRRHRRLMTIRRQTAGKI